MGCIFGFENRLRTTRRTGRERGTNRRGGLARTDSRLQTADQFHPNGVSLILIRRIRRHLRLRRKRHPYIASQTGIKLREFRGGNAEYCEQSLADQNLLAEHSAVAT